MHAIKVISVGFVLPFIIGTMIQLAPTSYVDSITPMPTSRQESVTDVDSNGSTYLPASQMYHVGKCDTDTEALARFRRERLRLENPPPDYAKPSSGYEKPPLGYDGIPICDNFYVVLDDERDDSITMKKIQNGEAFLKTYNHIRLNGRTVTVTIVRYL